MARAAAAAAMITFWAWWLQAAVVMAVVSSASREAIDPDGDCNESMHRLLDCIPYVTGRSPSPTPECCQETALVNVIRPDCLCMLLRSSADRTLEMPVNLTLALTIPTVCNISAASVGNCPGYLSLSPEDPETQFFETISATAPADSPLSMAAASTQGRRVACFLAGSVVAALMVPMSWVALS